MSASRRRGSPRRPSSLAASEASAPACASISPAPTGVPSASPIAAAASDVSPLPTRRSGLEDLRAEAGEIVLGERAEPDAVEKFGGPAPFVRQIAELADDRAERARQRAGRAERKVVGEAQEMRGLGERLRLRPAEPGEFRRLHLGRQCAPDIAQHLVPGGVDALGVLGGAMVHPRHHVASGRVDPIDGQGRERRRRARPASRWRRSRGRRRRRAEGRSPRPPREPPPSSRARCRRRTVRRRPRAPAKARSAAWRSR